MIVRVKFLIDLGALQAKVGAESITNAHAANSDTAYSVGDTMRQSEENHLHLLRQHLTSVAEP